MKNVVAQALGILAAALGILSFQQNKRKAILTLQLLPGLTFAVHFALLGAYTGAAMNLLAAAICVVYYNKGKPWADHRWWVILFSGLCVLSCFPLVADLQCDQPLLGRCHHRSAEHQLHFIGNGSV